MTLWTRGCVDASPRSHGWSRASSAVNRVATSLVRSLARKSLAWSDTGYAICYKDSAGLLVECSSGNTSLHLQHHFVEQLTKSAGKCALYPRLTTGEKPCEIRSNIPSSVSALNGG